MGTRGRQSSAALAVVPPLDVGNIASRDGRLQPPASLSEEQKVIFARLVNSCPVDWFSFRDLDALVSYARHTDYAEVAAQQLMGLDRKSPTFISDFDRLTKKFDAQTKRQQALARSMRISHQSCFVPKQSTKMPRAEGGREVGAVKLWDDK